MNIKNKLKFRDVREKELSDFYINRFVKKFINHERYDKIEITKEYIYLTKIGESGISHWTIQGMQPKTAREMIIYLAGVNYGN